MVSCLLLDKGSPCHKTIRSFVPFGSPESLPKRSALMANPTHASPCSSVLRPLQKKVKPAPTFEPPHDKTNKMTFAPSEDSDQPGHPSSVIRVFGVCLMGS